MSRTSRGLIGMGGVLLALLLLVGWSMHRLDQAIGELRSVAKLEATGAPMGERRAEALSPDSGRPDRARLERQLLVAAQRASASSGLLAVTAILLCLLYQRNQQARRDAEAANHLKDEFLATVSHELRTPLTAILGWATFLTSRTLDPSAAKRALETIVRNARVQARLIDDILDTSRMITGKLSVELRRVELVPVIEAAIYAVRPAADAKQIQLDCSLDAAAGAVSGDAARLEQVLWNLINNAVKVTPPGGRVKVELGRIGSRARITVSDTGSGIRPEFLPFAFERFRQDECLRGSAHEGLGLGLAIVATWWRGTAGRLALRATARAKGLPS